MVLAANVTLGAYVAITYILPTNPGAVKVTPEFSTFVLLVTPPTVVVRNSTENECPWEMARVMLVMVMAELAVEKRYAQRLLPEQLTPVFSIVDLASKVLSSKVMLRVVGEDTRWICE